TQPFDAMTVRFRIAFQALVVLAALVLTAANAVAHPHVWVTMKTELVYAEDGSITGVRHAWTFDDTFSGFAVQEVQSKQRAVYTREDLAALAAVNVIGLNEFAYFTFAKPTGRKTPCREPRDYYFEYANSMLTLHFTLPFATPVKAKTLDLEIYDPTYFVDFSFEEEDAVKLTNAPAGCAVTVKKPTESEVTAQ